MQSSNKTNSNSIKDDNAIDESSLDYSFLFSKLEQLSSENTFYRKAFSKIEEVAKKIADGNLSARITNWDEFDKLSPALSEINNSYDFMDNFIRDLEVTQKVALKNQDDFRKRQLQELKGYFEQQIAPILK